MLAARLHEYGSPLRLDEVPKPRPGPGEVLIRVGGAGFCHSDVHVIDGEIQILPRLPLTLGHENAGWVADTGAGVNAFKEGEPVAVYGAWGCGTCGYCVGGTEQLCITPQWAGLSERDGGYADYLLVPSERHLVRLTGLEPQDAAPLTDAALTPYRAVRRAQPYLYPGDTSLVIGVGGLGQYGIKLLRLLTGTRIVAVDITADKLEMARRAGADEALDGRDPELTDRIMDLTNGRGVGAAFDFVGSDATLETTVRVTRPLGKVSQLGLAGGTARMKVLDNAKFEVVFEATLWGTIQELREVIALVEGGMLQPIPSERVSLTDIQDAYDSVKSGRAAGRVVVVP